MYKDYVTKEDLKETIKTLKNIYFAMNKFGIEKLGTRCNTYGMASDFISIAGVGFLPLYENLGEYCDYADFKDLDYEEDDLRWELEQVMDEHEYDDDGLED